jgi:hypothetical protein
MISNEQNIDTYRLIDKARNALKKIQQISWSFNQFEKRFPFEEIEISIENATLQTYDEYIEQVRKEIHDYDLIMQDKKNKAILLKVKSKNLTR